MTNIFNIGAKMEFMTSKSPTWQTIYCNHLIVKLHSMCFLDILSYPVIKATLRSQIQTFLVGQSSNGHLLQFSISCHLPLFEPICSMYGISIYIGSFMRQIWVNVGKYCMHGASGHGKHVGTV